MEYYDRHIDAISRPLDDLLDDLLDEFYILANHPNLRMWFVRKHGPKFADVKYEVCRNESIPLAEILASEFLNWKGVAARTDITEKFVKEHFDSLTASHVCLDPVNFSDEYIAKHIELFDMLEVLEHCRNPQRFAIKAGCQLLAHGCVNKNMPYNLMASLSTAGFRETVSFCGHDLDELYRRYPEAVDLVRASVNVSAPWDFRISKIIPALHLPKTMHPDVFWCPDIPLQYILDNAEHVDLGSLCSNKMNVVRRISRQKK